MKYAKIHKTWIQFMLHRNYCEKCSQNKQFQQLTADLKKDTPTAP